jgi:hypothetical protein
MLCFCDEFCLLGGMLACVSKEIVQNLSYGAAGTVIPAAFVTNR